MKKVYVAMLESIWWCSDDGHDICNILGVFSSKEKAEKCINKQINELVYSETLLDGSEGDPFYHPSWGDTERYHIEVWNIDDNAKSMTVINKGEWLC